MIPYEEMKHRLAGTGRNRKWLAEQTGYSESTIKQYLGPRGKRTEDFMKVASEAIEAEEFRKRQGRPEAPLWNLIFLTHQEFDRADRASRIMKAESLEEFCRQVILRRADEIIAEKKRSTYRAIPEIQVSKVAEEP